jgi:bacillolysin
MLRFLFGFIAAITLVNYLPAQSMSWGLSGVSDGQFFISPTSRVTIANKAGALPQSLTKSLGNTRPDQWTLLRRSGAQNNRTYLHYTQRVRGHAVLGGAIQLQVSTEGKLHSISGRFFPDTMFVYPTVTRAPKQFVSRARKRIATHYPHVDQWNYAVQDTLWVPGGLLPDSRFAKSSLAYVLDFTEPGGVQAHRLFVDAETGRVIYHFPIHCSLQRRLFHRSPNRANLIWEEGNYFPGILTQEDQEALMASQETYALFWRTFGRDSYDGDGARLNVVTQAALGNCPNAVASGNRITHCPGVVTDDIVAHEWMHNYLASMNGLVYQYESGAINESFADIFGEVVDLLNDRGKDDFHHQPREQCEEVNVRWKIAEGTPALDSHIRDLWSPECKNHPSHVNSPAFACLPLEDNFGGVHINSGIINRTFTLLVDGGTTDSTSWSGIGLTKAAHIFWHAANNYLGPVTSFSNLADILEQSGRDLLGVSLTELTLVNLPAATAPDLITEEDLEQLRQAILATELRTPLPCNAPPALDPNTPETCAESSSGDNFFTVLHESWENGLPETWAVISAPEQPSSWSAKAWIPTNLLPNGRPGRGMLAPSPEVGNCRLDLENGQVHLISPALVLPEMATGAILRFDHYFATEEGFDGGVLDIALDDAPFLPVAGEHFLFNPYPSSLEDGSINDNPLAGREAFHGTDTNSDSGSWGTSLVDLTAAGVRPGQPFRLRWTMGHDGCGGWVGWYLDDVAVGYCSSVSLPVTYRSITARADKDRVHLHWELETSENNAGFVVERQGPQEDRFLAICFVPYREYSYQFTDREVLPGTTYHYRLRQQDQDGTESISPMVTATLPAPDFLLAPNPARDFLTLRLAADAPEKRGALYAITGQKMREFTLQPGQTLRLSTSLFSPGIYLIKVGDRLQKVEIRR